MAYWRRTARFERQAFAEQRRHHDLRIPADGLSAHRLLPRVTAPAMPDPRRRIRPRRRGCCARRSLAMAVAGGAARDGRHAGGVRPRSDRCGPGAGPVPPGASSRGGRAAPAATGGRASRGAPLRHEPDTPFTSDEMTLTLTSGEGAEIKAAMRRRRAHRLLWTATAAASTSTCTARRPAAGKAGDELPEGRGAEERPRRA